MITRINTFFLLALLSCFPLAAKSFFKFSNSAKFNIATGVEGSLDKVRLHIFKKDSVIDLSTKRPLLRMALEGDLVSGKDYFPQSFKVKTYYLDDDGSKKFIGITSSTISSPEESGFVNFTISIDSLKQSRDLYFEVYDSANRKLAVFKYFIQLLNNNTSNNTSNLNNADCDNSNFGDCQLKYFFDNVKFEVIPTRHTETNVLKELNGTYSISLPLLRSKSSSNPEIESQGAATTQIESNPFEFIDRGISVAALTWNLTSSSIDFKFPTDTKFSINSQGTASMNALRLNANQLSSNLPEDGTLEFDGRKLYFTKNGTRSEFGIQGPQGPAGSQGAPGPQGPQGAPGPQGPASNFGGSNATINGRLAFTKNGSLQSPYINGTALFKNNSSAKFNGDLILSSGAGAGYILKSDSDGRASWIDPTLISTSNASTLDNIDSSGFLRSNISDLYSFGTLTINGAAALDINSNSLSIADTEVILDGASTKFTQTTGALNLSPANGSDLNLDLSGVGDFTINRSGVLRAGYMNGTPISGGWSDPGYFSLRPSSREYQIFTFDGAGSMGFGRSDSSNALYFTPNIGSVSLSPRDGALYIKGAGATPSLVLCPAEGGGSGILQIGRRLSDSHPAVGASTEFWTHTSQTLPVIVIKGPGGVENLTSFDNGGKLAINKASAGTHRLALNGSALINGNNLSLTTLAQDSLLVAKSTGNIRELTKGNDHYVLKVNGNGLAWEADNTGGGSPGGSSNQIQYNNSGSFAGSSSLVFDPSTQRLGIRKTSPSANLDINGSTSIVNNISTTTTPLTIKGIASQTAKLQEWQDANGNTIGSISPSAIFRLIGNHAGGFGAMGFEIGQDSFYPYIKPVGGPAPGQWMLRDTTALRMYSNSYTGPNTSTLPQIWLNEANTDAGIKIVPSFVSTVPTLTFNATTYGASTTNATLVGGRLTLNNPSGSSIGLTVKAKANQVANLTEWQSNGGTAYSVIDNGGRMAIGKSSVASNVKLDVNGSIMIRETIVNDSVTANTSGASVTINWNTGNRQKITLDQNATISFTAPSGVGDLSLLLYQDSTGSRTVTWPANVKWPSDIAPTLTTAANKLDIINCFYDSTNYYCYSNLNYSQ